jgi:SAM-dependent methyltransferase
MKDIYSSHASDYMQMTKSWHAEDSPWKANQIIKLIRKNKLTVQSILEVGCGVGEVLYSLNNEMNNQQISFEGYDIASDAIKIAKRKERPNVRFYCDDLSTISNKYDLLLMIDVFEHVPDYIGFIEACKTKDEYKIFHIPLDIHLSAILRNKLIAARKSVGHIHYFTKETALATLESAGLHIVDYCYTDGADVTRGFKTKLANIPRKLLFPFLPDLTVKLIGGYSLLVLAK